VKVIFHWRSSVGFWVTSSVSAS